MSKRKLHERMALFNAGDWAQLFLESNGIAEAGTQAAVRERGQHVQDDISRRAARAERLALPAREPMHEDLTQFVPEHDFQLDPDVFWPMFFLQGGGRQKGLRA